MEKNKQMSQAEVNAAKEKTNAELLLAVRDALEILLALETLEYHNKNWLAYDAKIRNEEKRGLIEYVLRQLPKTAKCLYT